MFGIPSIGGFSVPSFNPLAQMFASSDAVVPEKVGGDTPYLSYPDFVTWLNQSYIPGWSRNAAAKYLNASGHLFASAGAPSFLSRDDLSEDSIAQYTKAALGLLGAQENMPSYSDALSEVQKYGYNVSEIIPYGSDNLFYRTNPMTGAIGIGYSGMDTGYSNPGTTIGKIIESIPAVVGGIFGGPLGAAAGSAFTSIGRRDDLETGLLKAGIAAGTSYLAGKMIGGSGIEKGTVDASGSWSQVEGYEPLVYDSPEFYQAGNDLGMTAAETAGHMPLEYGSDAFYQSGKDLGMTAEQTASLWDTSLGGTSAYWDVAKDIASKFIIDKAKNYVIKKGVELLASSLAPSVAEYTGSDQKGYNALNYQTTNNNWLTSATADEKEQVAQVLQQAAKQKASNDEKDPNAGRFKYLRDYIADISGKPDYLADYIA